MKKNVYVFDTILRDGEQGENVSFSLNDKIEIAKKLDEFGIDFIEGGWPGSNPKAVAFFDEMKNIELKHAKLCAFGSTRHFKNKPEDDPNLNALIDAATPAVSIFGKAWTLHVTDALKVSLDDNLKMVGDSVAFLKKHDKEVIFDAEHFFDGYKDNPEYALAVLKAAENAGASVLALCDTNGGSLPQEIYDITKTVVEASNVIVGIHAHNDGGVATANTLMAVKAGARHIQGTINGIGERTGNADLCSIIPNINLKMNLCCIEADKLPLLTKLSNFIYESGNISPDNKQPFVGKSAFAHKGGIHVSAVQRNSKTYEHITPESIGNKRRILISELSGRSNFVARASTFKVASLKSDDEVKKVLHEVKDLENKGYHFEVAEASLEILVKKVIGNHKDFFTIDGFNVFVNKLAGDPSKTEATVRMTLADGQVEHTAGQGDGPVDALNCALRKGVEKFYPVLKNVKLVDYKVRVLNNEDATAAQVRVLITSSDGENRWTTIGVSENVIEASYRALIDSIEYKLFLEEQSTSE